MTFTPVEIRHVKFAKSIIGGYKRDAVDAVLEEITSSFEDVWRDRADLADKVEQLEADIVRFRELEGLLRTTLVSAEKASVTLKEQAGKEADLIVVDPAFVAPIPGIDDDDPADLASRLIFRAHPDMVRGAWVRGRRLEGPSGPA